MSKKNNQSPAKEFNTIENSNAIAIGNLKEEENIIAEDAIVIEGVISGNIAEAPVEEAKEEKEENKEEVHEESAVIAERKVHDKPKKKASNRQGVIEEVGLASVVVIDINGNRFLLTGVNGKVGDIVEF